MPKIIIKNLNNKVLVNDIRNKSVLEVIHENLIDWMYSCGGKGHCTTCKMEIISGIENLSEPTSNENMYRKLNLLGLQERLSCQTHLLGDIEISVPEETKLPHIKYSN